MSSCQYILFFLRITAPVHVSTGPFVRIIQIVHVSAHSCLLELLHQFTALQASCLLQSLHQFTAQQASCLLHLLQSLHQFTAVQASCLLQSLHQFTSLQASCLLQFIVTITASVHGTTGLLFATITSPVHVSTESSLLKSLHQFTLVQASWVFFTITSPVHVSTGLLVFFYNHFTSSRQYRFLFVRITPLVHASTCCCYNHCNSSRQKATASCLLESLLYTLKSVLRRCDALLHVAKHSVVICTPL